MFVAFNPGRNAIVAIYHGIYIKKTGICHGIYHTNWYILWYISWYIPWYILLVGNLDLLLPHGNTMVYTSFLVYTMIYTVVRVLYTMVYTSLTCSCLMVHTNSDGI
jgi:hypothetical protein